MNTKGTGLVQFEAMLGVDTLKLTNTFGETNPELFSFCFQLAKGKCDRPALHALQAPDRLPFAV